MFNLIASQQYDLSPVFSYIRHCISIEGLMWKFKDRKQMIIVKSLGEVRLLQAYVSLNFNSVWGKSSKIVILNFMFQQPFQTLPQRSLKTSEPRFKRLNRIISPQSRVSTQQNFNPGGKTYTLDNSKQNLLYENHLTKVRSACKLDETAIVSKYLSSIRKDYDDMNKLSRKHLTSMKLKKKEIEFMKHKNQIFCEKRQQLEAQIVTQQKNTDEIKLKEEDAKMQTKTLQNIIVRMKKDQIFYKLQGRIRDQELKKKIKEVKLLDETLIHQEEKLHKLLSNLQGCKDLYYKNREVREKKFDDFSGKISDVKERERFIHERKERTYQLQSIELNDTLDEKNIHMREIILVHKVADSLLEGKVNTLIQKYSEIQGAFHLVKVKTGVNQPQQLTSKFFSYEQTSENLLETISDNERQLEELRQKKKDLTEKYKNLSNQHLIEDECCMVKNDCGSSWKEQIVNEINNNNLKVDSITKWINRMLLDVKQVELPKQNPIQISFETLCDSLQENLNKYDTFDWKDHKPSTMGVCLKKMIQEKSPEQLSLRMRQTQDLNESNLVEEQYIKSSRKVIQKKAFTIKQIKRDHHQ